MNIQLLKEGAVYLYYPKMIIKNYIDFDTGRTFERGYKILVGLDGVINYFFEGEQKKKLQKTVMDAFVTSDMWEVKEETAEWERLCQIDSEKNKLYSMYYVPSYKRRETFLGKKCIIYGAGKLGKKAMTELESLQVDILGFCDADVRKQGTNINGYKIYNFNRLLQMSNDDRCVVLVECSAERMEVINKLIEYGVNDIAFI
jgi:FlaA1/EpsC-like NDP-sugar epimerase